MEKVYGAVDRVDSDRLIGPRASFSVGHGINDLRLRFKTRRVCFGFNLSY
jgi:hypothetical protein